MGEVSLDAWIVELTKAESQVTAQAEAVLTKGALNIKNDWRERWTGHPHFTALPFSIGFDIYHLPGSARAQIGPDKNMRQGALGNIIEFGTEKNAPIPGGLPALDAETPRFEMQLALLGERLLTGRG